MTRSIRILLAASCGLLLLSSAPAGAHEPQADAGVVSASAAAPAAGIRGEAIANMMEAGDKLIELAGAVPANKWGWRPGKGVRSVGEVYVHVVQGNYFLCSFLGAKSPLPPEELKKLETTAQSPATMVKLLKDSYAFGATSIAELSDADLETTVTVFGQPMTKRAVLLILAAHSHEHLGQSIAYARMNKVVPPWTAREQAAAKQKAQAANQGQEGHTH
jgi:uncharacterized damage-inducible protein DinB